MENDPASRIRILQSLLRRRTLWLWKIAILGLIATAALASTSYGLKHSYITQDSVFHGENSATVPTELRNAINGLGLMDYLDRGSSQDWDLIDGRKDWSYAILLVQVSVLGCATLWAWRRSFKQICIMLGFLLILALALGTVKDAVMRSRMTWEREPAYLITLSQLRNAEAPEEVLPTRYENSGNAGDICLRHKGTAGLVSLHLPSGRCALALNPSALSPVLADQAHLVLAQQAFVAGRQDLVARHLQAMRGGWAFRDSHNFWRLRLMVQALEQDRNGEGLSPALIAMAKPAGLEADARAGEIFAAFSWASMLASLAAALIAARRTLRYLELRVRSKGQAEGLTPFQGSLSRKRRSFGAKDSHAAVSE